MGTAGSCPSPGGAATREWALGTKRPSGSTARCRGPAAVLSDQRGEAECTPEAEAPPLSGRAGTRHPGGLFLNFFSEPLLRRVSTIQNPRPPGVDESSRRAGRQAAAGWHLGTRN